MDKNDVAQHPDLTYVEACRDSLETDGWQPNREIWADLCAVALRLIDQQSMTTEQPDIARLRELLDTAKHDVPLIAMPARREIMQTVPALLDHLTQSEAEIARLKGERDTWFEAATAYLLAGGEELKGRLAAEAKLAKAVEVVEHYASMTDSPLLLLSSDPKPFNGRAVALLSTLKDDSPAGKMEAK